MLRGGSDAANVTEFGATCLDAFGTCGGGSHTINEFAWLESMPEAAKCIVAIAYYLYLLYLSFISLANKYKG